MRIVDKRGLTFRFKDCKLLHNNTHMHVSCTHDYTKGVHVLGLPRRVPFASTHRDGRHPLDVARTDDSRQHYAGRKAVVRWKRFTVHLGGQKTVTVSIHNNSERHRRVVPAS